MENYTKIKVKVKETYQDKDLLIAEIDGSDLIVKMSYSDIFPHEKLWLYGEYKQNKIFGKYFEVHFYREVLDQFWLAKWLKIYKKYKDKDIIKLILYKKGVEHVWEEFEKMQKLQNIFTYLRKLKVPEIEIAKIEKEYKWEGFKLIEDPYLLLKSADISFQQVQKIIQKFGCDNPMSSKGKFFVKNLLLKGNEQGHFYLPVTIVRDFLEKQKIAFENIQFDDEFYQTTSIITLKEYFNVEKSVSDNIKERLKITSKEKDESVITKWEEETGFTLAKNQKEAVLMALKENFCVVTGGPGVGKTTTSKCITDLLLKEGTVLMVAPTGRAAKRAHESTGLPTSTIHRLLEYNGYEFMRNEKNPIETDCLVIDEASMIDEYLLLALLKALPLTTKIIFVGDVDQLPSVGPGQILRDLIESGVVPVTRLTEIFRQAADSPIINCAYRVNEGKMPEIINHEDLIYIEKEKEEELLKETVEIATRLYQAEDLFDVQVLIPMYKGEVGIDNVNEKIQEKLHPHEPYVKVKHYKIKKNDKVIQTKNDYEKGIYNGDVGVVTHLTENEIKVLFQGETEEKTYTKDEFEQLQLSYAVTIHRAQGSEYKNAIIPVALGYGGMLQKNLLYTAITRAKKKLWILYQKEALEKSVRLESIPKRYTLLKKMLQDEKKELRIP